MSEEQKVIEVDIAQLCGIRNKLYNESLKCKDPILLFSLIGRHLKQLDSFLLHYGATASMNTKDGMPQEIKKPDN